MLTTLILLIVAISGFNSLRLIIPIVLITLFFRLNLLINNSIGLTIHDTNFSIDPLSANLIILSIWILAIVWLLRGKVFHLNLNWNMFKSLTAVLTLILIKSFTSNNLITFYVMFESTLLPTVLLILVWGYQPERLNAGIFIVIYIVVRSLPLLIIIVSTFSNHYSYSIFNTINPYYISGFENILIIFLLLAFIVKLPIYFFHIWLPKAHVEAPLAGSIILAAILLKLGAFGIIRIACLIPFWAIKTLKYFTVICVLGAVITSIICTRQTDLKSLIAYSSVRHMGVILAALSVFESTSWNAAILMLCAHAFRSSLLFALAAVSYEGSNSRRLLLTKGIIKLMPVIAIFWFIGAMISIGAPPFINLPAEILITKSLITKDILFIIIFIPILFVSAIYSLILFTSTSHGAIINFSKKDIKIPHSYTTAYIIHVIPPLRFIIIIKNFYYI